MPRNVLEVCESDGVGSSEGRETSVGYVMRLRSRDTFVGFWVVVDVRL